VNDVRVERRSVPRPRSAHRVVFIDLARAIAVILMVAGHTSSAMLGVSYREGRWFDAWTFQRGLTSALFLLLAGFAFSIATTRHWTTHLSVSAPVLKRARRFAMFVVLGYVLHLPVRPIYRLAGVSDMQWRSLLAVDVLQLIGTTLIAIQAVVLLSRSRRVFMGVSAVIALVVIGVAPHMWRTDWTAVMAPALAAYLSPATGSLFPLFPWAAYPFIGAATGQFYVRWGAARLGVFARWGMIVPGLVLIGIGTSVLQDVPSDVALRTGSCFLVMGVIALLSQRITQLPHVFGAVAQESLVVYFVHLCIVYGSVWNTGLYRFFGDRMSPLATLGFVVAVVLPMIGLAWYWNRLKHASPVTARWVTVACGIVLGGMLLFPAPGGR
jgi:uncharacterized membrane protein